MTRDRGTKFAPDSVSVTCGFPKVTAAGEDPVRIGTFDETVLNDAGAEVPPPGGGFVTVIAVVAGLARSAALSETASRVALRTCAGRGLPPNEAVDAGTKFVPVTTTSVAAEPAVTVSGASEVIVGVPTVTPRAISPEPPGPPVED
jgi:hypothetical protein